MAHLRAWSSVDAFGICSFTRPLHHHSAAPFALLPRPPSSPCFSASLPPLSVSLAAPSPASSCTSSAYKSSSSRVGFKRWTSDFDRSMASADGEHGRKAWKRVRPRLRGCMGEVSAASGCVEYAWQCVRSCVCADVRIVMAAQCPTERRRRPSGTKGAADLEVCTSVNTRTILMHPASASEQGKLPTTTRAPPHAADAHSSAHFSSSACMRTPSTDAHSAHSQQHARTQHCATNGEHRQGNRD